eukprot:704737-Rhodomonas_salina.1
MPFDFGSGLKHNPVLRRREEKGLRFKRVEEGGGGVLVAVIVEAGSKTHMAGEPALAKVEYGT